jgi:hypothetical protein
MSDDVERQAALSSNLDHIARSSAAIELIADIYKLLIEKQILTQGDAIARLEKVSNAVMASDTGTSRGPCRRLHRYCAERDHWRIGAQAILSKCSGGRVRG